VSPPATPRATARAHRLTTHISTRSIIADVEAFYAQCDPDKENLCLYGNPDGTWEVQLPAEEVPPELPEPALGINFARDGMQVRDIYLFVVSSIVRGDGVDARAVDARAMDARATVAPRGRVD